MHKPKPYVYNPNYTFLHPAAKLFWENQRVSHVSIEFAMWTDCTEQNIQTDLRVAGQMRHLKFSGYYLYHRLQH